MTGPNATSDLVCELVDVSLSLEPIDAVSRGTIQLGFKLIAEAIETIESESHRNELAKMISMAVLAIAGTQPTNQTEH